MLVVKIESWPHGDTGQAYEVGRAYIWSDGTGNLQQGNYTVAVMGRPDQGPFRDYVFTREILKDARLSGHVTAPRGHANLWPLVRRALKAAGVRARRAQPRYQGDR